jgi:hypothetical protein
MKNYVINNGGFTAAGNFTGYTAMGERVHIYARQMAANNWEADEDVKFPFYCLAIEKEIQPFDANGKPTGETVKRLTATSVFLTVDALAEAKGATILVEAKVNKLIAEEAVAAGLTAEAVADLLSVAV